MSYSVIAYQVDAKKIQSIWGSNDLALMSTFFAEFEDEIAEQLEDFDVELELYHAHLKDIISGHIANSEHNYIYGYLYELLCQKFGQWIESDEFMSFLDDVTKNNHAAFIPIPKNDDWPEFYSVPHSQLEKARHGFLSNDQEYAQEDYYIDEVNAIFDAAKESKMDLVFFAY